MHDPRPSQHAAPLVWPTLQHHATHSPPLTATRQAALAAYSDVDRAFGGTLASAARLCHGRRRQSHPGSPPAPRNSASLSPRSSASSCRRHVTSATERRFAVVLIAGRLEPTSTAYIRAPELNQVLDQPPVILLELPWPTFEEGKAFFPESGQFGRRQAPVDSVTTRASPSPISPPRTPPPSRECNPSINFGRRPPQPKNHFVTEAPLRRGARRR